MEVPGENGSNEWLEPVTEETDESPDTGAAGAALNILLFFDFKRNCCLTLLFDNKISVFLKVNIYDSRFCSIGIY